MTDRNLLRTIAAALVGIVVGAGLAVASDEPSETHQNGQGKASVQTGKVASFAMKSPRSTPYDLPDIPANDPTIEGGTLKFYELDNPANAMTFALPAGGWRKIGPVPASPRALQYRGTGLPGDPCRTVSVRPGLVKAICKGADVTLNPPLASGFLGVTLTVGTDSKQYCPAYALLRNDPGMLQGTPAIVGAESLCSPSGAFLDPE